MWVDADSLDYFKEQAERHGCFVLEGLPIPPERFATMSGSPQTRIAVTRVSSGGYAVLVPEDLTPRSADLAPYFSDPESVQGWRALAIPPCGSVEEALESAGSVLGIAAPDPDPLPPPAENRSAGSVRVPSGGKTTEGGEPSETGNGTSAPLPFTKDLTEAAMRGELSAFCGRDRELEQVLIILRQKERNCPLLVGEPGVGKTAVVERLAQLSAEGRLPEPMAGLRVFSLDFPLLVAESGPKGEMERNVSRLMDGLSGDPRFLLFVDEIHALMEARGDVPILEIMKPRLARGLRMIGATTHAEFKQKIGNDQALVRRFDLVRIEEPSPEETERILLARLPALRAHHGIQVPPAQVSEVVRLADEYFPDRRRPDKALMLLDRSMAAESLKAARSES